MKHLIAIALVMASGVYAQQPALLSSVRETNERYAAPSAGVIEKAILDTYATSANPGCRPTELRIESVEAATATPLVSSAITQGIAKNGWTVVARATGCEGQRLRFLLTLMTADNLRVLPMPPGSSLANVKLAMDTIQTSAPAVMGTLRQVDSSCSLDRVSLVKADFVTPVGLLGPDVYGARFSGSWKELWTFKACAHTLEVPVIYRADGNGGAYISIASDGVVARQNRMQ